MNFLGHLTVVGDGLFFTCLGSPAAQAWLGMGSRAGALLVVAGPLCVYQALRTFLLIFRGIKQLG